MIRGLVPRFVRGSGVEAAPDRTAVYRYLGYRPGKTQVGAAAAAAVEAGIGSASALLAPRAALVDCALHTLAGGRAVGLACGLTWRSQRLARALAGAGAITVVAATVGEGVEAEVERRFRAEEYAEATAADAAGTAAIHAWLQAVCRRVAGDAEASGLRLTEPFSPGYGDWPLDDLPGLLELTAAHRIGIRSNGACYLMPQKSVVAVVGWIDTAAVGRPRGRRLMGCSACAQADCAYREAPAAAAATRTPAWH